MRWTEAPHGVITNGNRMGGARSTPPFRNKEVGLESSPETSSYAPPNSVTRKKSRLAIMAAVVFLVTGIVFWIRHIPATVTGYEDLESRVDRRVEFVGTFDGDQKTYDLIIFQGRPILFHHALGAIDWSPHTGERCKVVGRLETYGRSLHGEGKIDYALTQAEYYPSPHE